MQTISLKVEDGFFPHFKALIDSLVKDKKVELVDDDYDYENNYPQSVVVSSVEEVRRRVYEAEDRVKKGEYLNEAQYDELMNKFFKEELGINRR
jgi:hypothetical protein